MLMRLLFASLCLCAATQLQAAVIVSFDSTSVAPNQTRFVNVWLESSDDLDSLAGFRAYFRISGPTVNGNLEFASTATQPNSQAIDGYVFKGHLNANPLNYSATRLSSNELLLIDFLDTLKQKPLGSTKWLLASLAVVHSTSAPAASEGDTYTIQMFTTSLDTFDDTVFFDSTNDLSISASAFLNSGSIRVTSAAAAVPEASAFVASALGILIFGVRRLRVRELINSSAI